MLVVAEREQLPVARARARDPNAWEVLFKRYQLPLYVYVFEMVRDEQSSFDLVQDTFVSAIRYVGSLRNDNKFGSWLFGIAHQKCIQHWRKQNRENAALEEITESPPEAEDDPSGLLVRREQEDRFMKLTNQLPRPQRSALLLRYVEDFSLEEIANITGTSLGTVKSRLHYAKHALKNLLEGEDA